MDSGATQCAVCQSSRLSNVIEGLLDSRFGVKRCEDCALEFLYPQPHWEEIQKIYSSGYYSSWDMTNGENQITGRMKRLTFALRLRELSRFVDAGPILDIGTATGFFLDEVRLNPQFEPYGVELSTYAGTIARGKFGAERIHIGTLETAPFPPAFFAAAAMSDLIEHVQNPYDTLQRVHALLKPRGVAMIMTPDVGSLSRKVMGSRWTHYKLEHLFYFSEPAMRKIAADTGFHVLEMRRAKKVMTLKYLRDQLAVYRHPFLTPLSQFASAVLSQFGERPFTITLGEMLVFLAKA